MYTVVKRSEKCKFVVWDYMAIARDKINLYAPGIIQILRGLNQMILILL